MLGSTDDISREKKKRFRQKHSRDTIKLLSAGTQHSLFNKSSHRHRGMLVNFLD